jgi:hypothetical protein
MARERFDEEAGPLRFTPVRPIQATAVPAWMLMLMLHKTIALLLMPI